MLHGMLGLHNEACTETNTRTILYGHPTPGRHAGVAAAEPPTATRVWLSATRRFLVDSRTQFDSQAARVEKVPIY